MDSNEFSGNTALPADTAPGAEVDGGYAGDGAADTQSDQATFNPADYIPRSEFAKFQSIKDREVREWKERWENEHLPLKTQFEQQKAAQAEYDRMMQLNPQLDPTWAWNTAYAAAEAKVKQDLKREADAEYGRQQREAAQRQAQLQQELGDVCDELEVTDAEYAAVVRQVDPSGSPEAIARRFAVAVVKHRKAEARRGDQANAVNQRSNLPLPRGGASRTAPEIDWERFDKDDTYAQQAWQAVNGRGA